MKKVEGEGPAGGYKVHTTLVPDSAKPKLVSVLEQNSLDEFVSLAQLSAKQFEAERGGAVVVAAPQIVGHGANSVQHQASLVTNFIGES